MASGRILALDHGPARCGCALSDPLRTLATPLAVIARPDTRRGLAAVVGLVAHHDPDAVVVGLPLTLRGEEGDQAQCARRFATRLGEAVAAPVELYDERLTTRMAERSGDSAADEDSRAAAHLLEGWLARTAAPAGREGA